MIISKGEFVSIMNTLQAAIQLEEDINALMRKAKDNIRNDFMNAAGLIISHEGIVIELLSKIFDDVGDWISWWVYETAFGKNEDMIEVYDGNDETIAKIKTAEDLYDFLIKEME